MKKRQMSAAAAALLLAALLTGCGGNASSGGTSSEADKTTTAATTTSAAETTKETTTTQATAADQETTTAQETTKATEAADADLAAFAAAQTGKANTYANQLSGAIDSELIHSEENLDGTYTSKLPDAIDAAVREACSTIFDDGIEDFGVIIKDDWTECIWVQLKTPADAPAGASAAYYGSFPVPRDAVEEERISNVKPELSDCGSTSSIRANLGGN